MGVPSTSTRHDGHERDGGHDAAGAPAGTAAGAWWSHRQPALLAVTAIMVAVGFAGEQLGWSGPATRACFLAGIVSGMLDIAPEGLRGIWEERSLDISFLVTVAVLGALVLGEWSEAATVVLLFSAGEAIERSTFARTRRAIRALMTIAPAQARVKRPDGSDAPVPVEDVPVGSIVAVRPGDRIPLDGEVTGGASSVDQAPITGESVPVDKAIGDAVFAGTINGSGYLEIRTTRPFGENTLARIIDLVERAQSEKAPAQRLVERFARLYTPAIVAGAIALATVPPLLFGQPFVPWFNRALVLLLVACPCALVVSTPVSVMAAIGSASRHGVLIKGGQHLEHAGKVRVVALDKTGTLTRGVPEVQQVYALDGVTEDALLRLAAAAESRSEHPLAQAIVRAARRRGLGDLPPIERFQASAGSGIAVQVGGTALLLGNASWIEQRGASLQQAHEALRRLRDAGQSAVVIARERSAGNGTAGAGGPHVAGIIAIADEVRPVARDAVRALRASGLDRVVLLTGDNPVAAHAVAQQVGIPGDDVYAGLLPEEKSAIVRQLVARHRWVAMVGDGVNDAPALAAATVGIAMGAGGSDVALETADVALVAGDLSRLPWIISLSRRAARTIKINVALALAIKAAVLALVALGIANLWLAIAADTGATIVVSLNGMRLLGKAQVGQPAAERRPALQSTTQSACTYGRYGKGRDPSGGPSGGGPSGGDQSILRGSQARPASVER